jgi:hypothetical protein
MVFIIIGFELLFSFLAVLILEKDINDYNWNRRFFLENFRSLIFDFLKKLLLINLVILFLVICGSLIQYGLMDLKK